MNKTELKDRTLWYDGDSTFSSSKLSQFIQLGNATDGLFVDEITDDIKQFNKLVSPQEQIKIKEQVNKLDFSWNIPKEYKYLNVTEYVIDRFLEQCGDMKESNWDEWNIRANRVSIELSLYKDLELYDVLRTIIYIINTLDSKKVVWGVGRGSSVSSYILYLIGVHDVDSVLYDLDINDFLRTK